MCFLYKSLHDRLLLLYEECAQVTFVRVGLWPCSRAAAAPRRLVGLGPVPPITDRGRESYYHNPSSHHHPQQPTLGLLMDPRRVALL